MGVNHGNRRCNLNHHGSCWRFVWMDVMKATINKDGFIVITAETYTEAWALQITCPTAAGKCDKCGFFPRKVVVDCGILLSKDEKHLVSPEQITIYIEKYEESKRKSNVGDIS